MAGRPPRNQIAMKDLHRHVKALQRRRPATSKDLELWAYDNLGGIRLATETCRKGLTGNMDPTGCGIELLLTLAGYFDAEPHELGEHAGRRLEIVGAFFTNHGGPPDQGIASSRWGVQSAA